MTDEKQTELEAVLKKTVEKQSQRIANLTLNLDLARSQIELMKEKDESPAE